MFKDLHRKIDFKSLFLNKLLGATLSKSQQIFLRLGTLIRARLLSKDCIDPKKCPKSALKILTHSLLDGWNLLEVILKSRLVICGAPPDFDLDKIRSNLTLLPNETFTEFYIRTQHIINEYDMNTRGEMVPITKITDKFINELSRAPVYVPYLARYQTELVDHIVVFGDNNYKYLPPISPSEIHAILVKVKAPLRPPVLHPSHEPSSVSILAPTAYLPGKSTTPSSITEVVDVAYPQDINAVISVLQQTADPDCTHPVICMQTNQRDRCKACLVGYHEEVNCYARGPAFLPPSLRRRIMVYNQTHGDKPPADHVHKEYTPRGVTPDHAPSSSSKPRPTYSNHKKDVRPFSNYHTKSKNATATIRSFQFVNNRLEPVDVPTEDDTIEEPDVPTIKSFLQTQSSLVDSIIAQDKHDDTNDPVICSMLTSPIPTARVIPYLPRPQPHTFALPPTHTPSARHDTPIQLSQIITKAHSGKNPLPSKSFLQQFNRNFSKLDHSRFRPYCRMESNCDQGANVGSVMDLRYFLFYIPSATSVQQVGGDMLPSPGWGGVLFQLNGLLYLQTPTYYCPGSPQNTFSPSCLKIFSNFKKVIVDTNVSMTLIDDRDNHSNISFDVHNGLDYVNLEIMRFNKDVVHPTIATTKQLPLRRSPRLHLTSTLPTIKSPQLPTVLPPDTMIVTVPSDNTSNTVIVLDMSTT